MQEQQTKNRGWVKNAAIIFLSVMLVLTFFSNTIMNRSLPEVATQVAQQGTITTRIRGTAPVEAAETFEVKTTDTRKVKSVLVKLGQEVKVGDSLVVLDAGSSDELLAAQDALDDAIYQYQVALISQSEADATGDSPEVQLARVKLEEAIAKRDNNKVDAANLAAAKAKADTLNLEYQAAQDKLTAAGGETSGGGGGGDYSAVTAAQNALAEAQTALQAAKVRYQEDYDALYVLAMYLHSINGSYSVDAYMQALDSEYAPSPTSSTTGSSASSGVGQHTASASSSSQASSASSQTASVTGEIRETEKNETTIRGKTVDTINIKLSTTGTEKPYKKTDMAAAYTAITDANAAVTKANQTLSAAQNSYNNSFSPDNSYLMSQRDKAKSAYEAAKKIYDDMKTMSDTYDTARQSVIDAQAALNTAIVNQKKQVYDLQRYQKDVTRAQQKVAKLATGGAGGEIKSDVNGVVKTINVTAGNTADPNTAVLTVEVPDRGYTASISVTREQAKRVTVGDSAEISTGYWGGSGITGKLVNIKPDPQNASANRLLVFELTGEDIDSGTQVSVSIGQKSQSYELIVPSSAVRSDSNGSFVYVVTAKQSPLGSRYVATRVDVQVLAKDDTNTAISGGVAQGDYVITTSTKPIEKGMQVRLADN